MCLRSCWWSINSRGAPQLHGNKSSFWSMSARWVIAWRRLRMSEDLSRGLKTPLTLSAFFRLGPWWCVSFNFSSLFLALILSAVRLIRFNSISLKCPLIVSAPVIHEQCLMMCFYYQLYFSLTRQQYFSILASSNALILCPSGLRARLCLMMSTTTAQLRRGLCLVYDFWLWQTKISHPRL